MSACRCFRTSPAAVRLSQKRCIDQTLSKGLRSAEQIQPNRYGLRRQIWKLHSSSLPSQGGLQEKDESASGPVPEAASLTGTEVGNNIIPARPLGSRDTIEVPDLPTAGDAGPWQARLAMLKTIVLFAGPALSIPLGDPLMSLVDTVCVGQFASTLELAALGPNTLIFQFSTYVVAALATACTCLMSECLDKQRRDDAGSVLSTSLVLGAAIGIAQMLILTVGGANLVAMTRCSPELVAPATTYLRIRALSAPTVLLLMVAQSGLLAQKDSWTPCLGVLVQLTLNCILDVLLIGHFSGGLAGAAWATVFAQWAGCLVTLWCLPRGNRVKPQLSCTREDIRRLFDTFGPASLILLCKNFVYVAVTGTASALPRLQAAAHQPLYGIWNLGGFAHVPLEQAALAFVPASSSKGQGRETVSLLLGLAVAVGIVTSLFTAGLPTLLPQLFTKDAALYPIIRSVAPQALLSIFLCSLDVCSGGILIATRDMGFLVKVMGVALLLVLGSLATVRRYSFGLAGVWWTLVVFFFFRAANSCGRIFYLSKHAGSFLHRDNQMAMPRKEATQAI